MVSGCAFGDLGGPDNRANLSDTDLVGTWSHGPGSTIEFRREGGFTAVGLPEGAFAPGVVPTAPPGSIDGTGASTC
jgi:hypothetical protein